MAINKIEDLVRFLIETPPYKQEEVELLKWLTFAQKTIIIEQFCEKCKKSRSFKLQKESFSAMYKDLLIFQPIPGESSKQIEPKTYFVKMEFECLHNCGEKHVITLKITNDFVEKVGQYPTFVKNEIANSLIKYKNVMPKFYPELTKAESCYSHGLGIPSFVYLRRILENLVNEKYYKISSKNIKFIEKIKILEDVEEIIPSDLESVKEQIYSVLSKGIHEYEEKECIDLYSSVKYIIECILDNELLKKERKEKAKKAIQAINGKLLEEDNG